MKALIASIKIFLVFTLLTGIIYPFLVTGIAQLMFRHKANGSIIMASGKAIGSALIGQQFDSTAYFFSRPSAISYNPLPSAGSNYGLTNAKLKEQVIERQKRFAAVNQLNDISEVPPEMVFASASGLDPHISPRAAYLQVQRISKVRNLNPDQKKELTTKIESSIISPRLEIFGESCINVLELNLYLDQISHK
jgi:K+-transporting ATPase ATPase C chain